MAEAVYENGGFFVDDDLLNFSLDEEVEEQHKKKENENSSSSSSYSSSCLVSHHDDSEHHDRSSPSLFVEEELEWLSNKDAFPAVETCFDILSVSDDPSLALDYDSPVSVLENSSSSSHGKKSGNSNGSTMASYCGGFLVPVNYPVRKRSRRRRRRQRAGFSDLPNQQNLWLNLVTVKSNKQELALPPLPMTTKRSGSSIGRRCLHCLAEKTPQWRAGPMGPKTLCNACGVRYKSGRLVPEYRPACSPTFSAALHSNSHRKIVEMRRQKQMTAGGMVVNQDCGYSVDRGE